LCVLIQIKKNNNKTERRMGEKIRTGKFSRPFLTDNVLLNEVYG
jgi:hypothetical protein